MVQYSIPFGGKPELDAELPVLSQTHYVRHKTKHTRVSTRDNSVSRFFFVHLVFWKKKKKKKKK
jgi:hypothetical protein